MGKNKIRSKDFNLLQYHSHKARSIAIALMAKHFKHSKKAEKLEILQAVKETPAKYLDDPVLGVLAAEFKEEAVVPKPPELKLPEAPKQYPVFGKKLVDNNTLKQMDMAMRLPVTIRGALMPDAHHGYGIPVGGVLATQNAVIPYGVGLDIGCRMALSLLDVPPAYLKRHHYQFKMALDSQTHFGIGKVQDTSEAHEVLDRQEFQETELLRLLKGKAAAQIGTSGSGNHFVEFGIVEVSHESRLNLEPGKYVGILSHSSHSGSRGFGATIAQYYTKVAMDTSQLPREAKHLAWLDLDSEAGQEYWIAMNLAGDYAKACHDVIHRKLTKLLGLKTLMKVENHHNFAWKEKVNGEELVVHRKGATPAQEGVLGIIPGSMTAPGYIVSGKGNPASLSSASHGAGRMMSRRKARNSITRSEMRKRLTNLGITLLGGGVDEAPMAYKDLELVMSQQQDLVRVEGQFFPKIVKMNNDEDHE